MLVGVLAGTEIAQDRSVAQAVERIPAASRSVRAVWFGAPVGAQQAYAAIDDTVRAKTVGLDLPAPTPIVLFRESTVAGRFVSLAGVDGLARYVRLTGGRLPRRCSAERCEVLRLRGSGTLPDAPGLRLVQVGTAALRSGQLFGDFLAPTDNALDDRELAPALQQSAGYHRPRPAPLVVAEGVEALTRAPAVGNSYRSYAWVWPLTAGRPRSWQVGGLIQASEQARAALQAAGTGYSLQAPVEELRATQAAAEQAGRRLLLVGGEAAALLFAFVILAAWGMRRDLEAARRRLTWYGAARWQLRLLTGVESSVVAVAGVLAGWLVGVAAGGIAARRAGAPVGAVLGQSLLAPMGIALVAGVTLAAALMIALATSVRTRRSRRFGPLDAAALVSLAIVGASLAGGAADTSRLEQGESAGFVLLVLPGLIAFALAVVAARVFGPSVRHGARLARPGIAARLAAVTLGRGPGAAAVTVAFLTLAFGLALLAESYRATLVRAEHDQAAFVAPLDIVVREDLKSLIPVLDAAPLDRYAALAGGVEAVPVLRLRASTGSADGVSGVTVLGLPATAVARLHGWREEFAVRSRASLVAALTPPSDPGLRGIPVGSRLGLVAGPGLLSLRATIVSRSGRVDSIDLGPLSGSRATRIDRALPPSLRGGTLLALVLRPPKLIDRGADAGPPLAGRLTLSGIAIETWIGEGGVEVSPVPAGLELRFRISQQNEARVRARQATDISPPAVLVTPRLGVLAGGVGGLLPLEIGGGSVAVRVAAIVDRFPGTTGEAVVGDVESLETAVTTQVPGAGRTNEVWLELRQGQERAAMSELGRPPFRGVEAVSRAELIADARNDPLGHGTLVVLGFAAGVALLLASLGLALTVRSDLRDDRGDLYDLEAQGAEPSLLRRVVRVRALVVGAAGLLAGALTGALLSLLVTRVVAVTSRSGRGDLPLQTSIDLRVAVLGVLAFGALTALLVAVVTRRAFSDGRGPARAQEGGT